MYVVTLARVLFQIISHWNLSVCIDDEMEDHVIEDTMRWKGEAISVSYFDAFEQA